MDLCERCIEQVIPKLTVTDVFILDELKDKTSPLTGIQRNDLLSRINDGSEYNISVFQLNQAIIRLDLLGFILITKSGRHVMYSITPGGTAVLERLNRH